MVWLCVHFPHLALEVISRGLQQPRMIAITAARGSKRWIHDCDQGSLQCGVSPGMGLATAYALAPDLDARPQRPHLELQALQRLAALGYAFSSQVSISPPDALLLEVGASIRLFGTARNLCRDLLAELHSAGHTGCMALATTARAALLLTRAGHYRFVKSLTPMPKIMADIPVDCLELSGDIIGSLHGVGAHTLGQTLKLPRDGLGRRFGQQVTDYLDRLLGNRPDPLEPYRPEGHFESLLELPAEVPDTTGLVFALRRLIDELCAFLRSVDRAVQQLQFEMQHAPPARPTQLALGLLEPDRDANRLTELLRERVHGLELPAPVRAVRLKALELLQIEPTTPDLFRRHAQQEHQWARVVERLRSRLGKDAVYRLACEPDHRPERAWSQVNERQPPGYAPDAERPLWLLHQPRPLNQPPAKLISGPERIETGWWDGMDVCRDYYVAEAEDGRRLWVYQDRRGPHDWYLHGLFS